MTEPLEAWKYSNPEEWLDRKRAEDKKELRRKEAKRKNLAALHRAQVKKAKKGIK